MPTTPIKLFTGEEFAPWVVRTARSVLEAVVMVVILMVGDALLAINFGEYTPFIVGAIKIGGGQLEGIADQIDSGKVRANQEAVRLREGLALPPTEPST